MVVLLGQGESETEARALVERYRAADLDAVLEAVTTRWDDLLGAVQVKTPDRSLDLMLNRWLLYQTLACRVLGARRLLPGGRRLRLPRPAAGRDGADRGRPRHHAGAARAGPPPASSSRATSSTGGIRPPDAACARASRTTWSGCPTPSAHYVAVTGDAERARRGDPVPRGPAAGRRAGRGLLRAHRLRPARLALRALRPGARSEPGGGRARPAPDGRGRLERRHEPGRAPRAGRERLARLVPASPPSSSGRRSRTRAARRRAGRALARPRRRRCGRRSRPTAGTATGIAGPTSTTAPRSARRRTRSAASTPSPSPGPCSRARPTPLAPPGPWPRWRSISCGASRRSSCSSRRRSCARVAIPATSGLPAGHPRERRPVHARRHLGHHGLRRARATAIAPASSSPSSIPSTTPARAPASTAIASSPTSWRPTSTPSRPISAAAAGPGTRGRRAGCTGRASSGCSGFRLRGAALFIDPVHPAGVERLLPALPLSLRRATRSRWRTRAASPAGSRAWRSTACASSSGPRDCR